MAEDETGYEYKDIFSGEMGSEICKESAVPHLYYFYFGRNHSYHVDQAGDSSEL